MTESWADFSFLIYLLSVWDFQNGIKGLYSPLGDTLSLFHCAAVFMLLFYVRSLCFQKNNNAWILFYLLILPFPFYFQRMH